MATRLALGMGMVVALWAGQARAATTVDGSCDPVPAGTEALAELGSALSTAVALGRNCIPEGDPRRPYAEENERRAIENAFGTFVRGICEDRICVNNGWGFVLDAYDDRRYDEKTLMSGCGRWAIDVASNVKGSKPKYWEIGEAQYGKDSGRPGYHWVVEMRNTRTGKTFVLDGYEASKSGRNLIGSNMSDAGKIRRAGGIRTPKDVERQWGKRNAGGHGCQNEPGTLCDGCQKGTP